MSGAALARRVAGVAASAGLALAAVLVSAATADAKGRDCARPNTVTVASTSTARVWRPGGSASSRLYGCLKSLDRTYRLDRSTPRPGYWAYGGKPDLLTWRPGWSHPGLRRWYFGGRFVGFWAQHGREAELWVYSLRSGRLAVRAVKFDYGFNSPPALEGGVSWGPLLATNGVPVWISIEGDEGLYEDRVAACRDTGADAWSRPCSYWFGPGPFGGHSFQAARGITPTTLGMGDHDSLRSLRVSGTTVRWTRDGAARSRSVAFLGS